jgi:hypothetical protein
VLLVLVGMLSGSATEVPTHRPASGHYSAPIGYDGRFTLVRLRWGADRRGGSPHAWSHGYPRAEQNLSAIIRELTYLDIHDDGNEILTLDDPELFKYPIALMWEPGFWSLTDREAASFRAYLQKGGFAIFEDFDGHTEWGNFESQMRRVLPDGRLARLDSSHQIFNTFFPIKDIEAIVHPTSKIRPSYYGIFEDNDPSKRLLVAANYDNDVPDYWERSGEGLYPSAASHDAYKLGVNYMLYGLTH